MLDSEALVKTWENLSGMFTPEVSKQGVATFVWPTDDGTMMHPLFSSAILYRQAVVAHCLVIPQQRRDVFFVCQYGCWSASLFWFLAFFVKTQGKRPKTTKTFFPNNPQIFGRIINGKEGRNAQKKRNSLPNQKIVSENAHKLLTHKCFSAALRPRFAPRNKVGTV